MKTTFFNKAFFFAATLLIGTSACTQAQQPYDGRYDNRRYEDDRYAKDIRRYDNRDRNGRFNPELRQREQNMRIEQGIRSGSLTRKEVRNLRRLQSDTDRAIYAARANGYTSPRERMIITDLQDRIDRTITWEKRDRQGYPGRW